MAALPQPLPAAAAPSPRLVGGVAALGALAGFLLGVPAEGLGADARVALVVFAAAIVGWTCTPLDDALVALGAALGFVVAGVLPADALFATLGDPTVWLLLGAFVVAGAVEASGLAQRLALLVALRARTVGGLLHGLTAALAATALVLPSTSGRAALAVPVFAALAQAVGDRRVVRALALLVPVTILLSAVASLVGAGAHLVTVEVLEAGGHGTIGFAQWLLLGVPFAVVSCALSTWVLGRLFLTGEERRRPLALTAGQLAPDGQGTGPLTGAERRVLAVLGALVLLWATEPLHGLDAALVAVLGALAVSVPGGGGPPFKQALRDADWSLLVFLAATLALGTALVQTGAAAWLADAAFAPLRDAAAPLVVAAVALVSLLAHLVVTSRTARSTVLVPLVVALGAGTDVNPVLLAFVSTAAAGFCLTLTVSAKPVLLFSRLDVPTYDPGDLLRLSRWLLPAHLVLLVLFALVVWPALGLPL